MAEKLIQSFSQLHNAIQSYRKKSVIYRGLTDASDELVPEIGRNTKLDDPEIEGLERWVLRLFKEQALPYLSFVPKNDWEWLAIAWRSGLPTRLLDWTRNPLIAAYFAVEQEHDGDSAIYAYRSDTFIRTERFKSPFDVKTVGKFIQSHITRRITAQVGVFTIHPFPTVPFQSPFLDQLTISRKSRKELKWILYRYGIHRASLFPDLDGLVIHIKWLRTGVH